MVQSSLDNSLAVSYKTKLATTTQPSNTNSWLFIPEKWNLYSHKSSSQIFTVDLFEIAPNCKQPRWSSMGDWLNKLWHIHALKYYAAIKGQNYRHDIGIIIVSIISQFSYIHTVWFHLYSEMRKLQKWRPDWWLPGLKGMVVGRIVATVEKHEGSLWG